VPAQRLELSVWRLGMPTGLVLLLLVGSNEACAAALGSLVTSAGLLAALAALFIVKGWPAHLPASALSTAGGALVVAVGAAWAWRVRVPQRLLGFAGPLAAPRLESGPRPALRCTPRAAIELPLGIERESLLVELRLHFVRLQAAWDLGDMATLGRMTTPDMLAELCFEWREATQSVRASNRTDVVTLHAELLGFEELAAAHLVSVEFSGLIRETAEQGALPFREVWMLAKTKPAGEAWKLARQQALL
jgi:predicted lipid-binding transport protein (Tim44 family)